MLNDRLRCWFFPLAAFVLLIIISCQNLDSLANRNSISYTYLRNALQGRIGYGIEGKYWNMISFDDLEPGDLLLGGYPQCAYGRFSHAGIYIGNGQVMESYVDLGVTVQPIDHYWNYSEISLLRVKAQPEQKQAAVDYVKSRQGGLFYPVAFKPGERFWNCSKIVWEAYRLQGINLEESQDIWISPDEFYKSPWVQVIREKSV